MSKHPTLTEFLTGLIESGKEFILPEKLSPEDIEVINIKLENRRLKQDIIHLQKIAGESVEQTLKQKKVEVVAKEVSKRPSTINPGFPDPVGSEEERLVKDQKVRITKMPGTVEWVAKKKIKRN